VYINLSCTKYTTRTEGNHGYYGNYTSSWFLSSTMLREFDLFTFQCGPVNGPRIYLFWPANHTPILVPSNFLIKSVTFLFLPLPLFLYFACVSPCLLHYTDWPASHKRLDHTGVHHQLEKWRKDPEQFLPSSASEQLLSITVHQRKLFRCSMVE
jgi:hypothetical protein